MKPIAYGIAIASLFIAIGCSEVIIQTHGKGGDPKAMVIPASRPYLLVERSVDGQTVLMRVVQLPDPTRSYYITVQKKPRWWPVGATFRADLTPEGFLRSIAVGTSPSGPEPTAEAVQQLSAAMASALTRGRDNPNKPSPGLYAMEFDGNGRLVNLRQVPFAETIISNDKSYIEDFRFLEDSEIHGEVKALATTFKSPEPFSCPPPGFSVDVLTGNGELLHPCDRQSCHNGLLLCPIPDTARGPYLARATWAGTTVERWFPAEVSDVTSQRRPTASISFATDSLGRVTAVAIRYDSHGESCVAANDPGDVRIRVGGRELREGEAVWEPAETFGKDGVCLAARLIRFTSPVSDVAVLAVPRNRWRMEGEPVFASASVPHDEKELKPSPPTLVNITTPPSTFHITPPPPQILAYDRDKGTFSSVFVGTTTQVIPPQQVSGHLPHVASQIPRIRRVVAEIENGRMSTFEVQFSADRDSVAAGILVSAFSSPTQGNQNKAIELLSRDETCKIPAQGMSQYNASITSLELMQSPDRYRAKISLDSPEKVKSPLVVQMQFSIPRQVCRRFVVRQDLLAKPQDNEVKPKSGKTPAAAGKHSSVRPERG